MRYNNAQIDKARGLLTQFANDYLRMPNGDYRCPVCGSGTGNNGTGALKIVPESGGRKYRCFSARLSQDGKTGHSGDVLDLVGAEYGIDGMAGQIGKLDSLYPGVIGEPEEQDGNLGWDDEITYTAPHRGRQINEQDRQEAALRAQEDQERLRAQKAQEIANKVQAACKTMEEDPGNAGARYLLGRGLSWETIKRYKLGYLKRWETVAGKAVSGIVVIPYQDGADACVDRPLAGGNDTGDGSRVPKYYKHKAGGEMPVYIAGKPTDDHFCFVTEGQLDALSLMQSGADCAIATGGEAKMGQLLGALRALDVRAVCYVADADPAGEAAAEAVTNAVRGTGIIIFIGYPAAGCKDSNDMLRGCPDALRDCVTAWTARARAMIGAGGGETMTQDQERQGAARPDDGIDIDLQTMSDYAASGQADKDLDYFVKYDGRKTGWPGMDKHLTLYPGLAVFGGASSLGKTTFAWQLCDQLLKAGESVLYITLEQTRAELYTKSIARMAYEQARKDGCADSVMDEISNLNVKRRVDNARIKAAKAQYVELSRNCTVVSGTFAITVNQICDYVNGYIRRTGKRPVVVVDYLQIISPPSKYPDGSQFRGGIREAIDYNIMALKRLQVDNELLIIAISSFNRTNYTEPLSYSSFKESGMLEYSCDYVWGLQLKVQRSDNTNYYTMEGKSGAQINRPTSYRIGVIDNEQSKIVKDVQFVSLKNRNGKQRFTCNFEYHCAHDCYVEESSTGFVRLSALNKRHTPFDNADIVINPNAPIV